MARPALRRSRTSRSTKAAWVALAALVAAGAALRLLLILAYRPAVFANADSARYLHFALESPGLLNDPFGPTGYSAFLCAALPAVAAMVVVFGAYAIDVAAQDGKSGLTDLSGWNTYARAAPFAKCSEFTPPDGTGVLCETRPPKFRHGTIFYLWRSASPA